MGEKTQHSMGVACYVEQCFWSFPRDGSILEVSFGRGCGLVGSSVAWGLADTRLWRLFFGLGQKRVKNGLVKAFRVAFGYLDR